MDIPITPNPGKVCEVCRQPVTPSDVLVDGGLIACINTANNTPTNVCKNCLNSHNHIIPIDECVPSGDVTM